MGAKPRSGAGNVIVYGDVSGIPDVGITEDCRLTEENWSEPVLFLSGRLFLSVKIQGRQPDRHWGVRRPVRVSPDMPARGGPGDR
jgi:hypothetical protein